MADDTVLNVGSGGDTIASDDIGGVKHQRVKQQFGPDGSATDVSAAAPLPVDQQAQSPQRERLTSANLSAGANVDLTASDIATGTGRLIGATIGASVPLRCDIQSISGARTTHDTVFTRAGESRIWRPPHRDFFTHAGVSAGLDVFQADVTNMDTSEAADVYATFYYGT